MAVKFAHAMGAEVTLLTRGTTKMQDAKRLGADHCIDILDKEQMSSINNTLNIIIDTISAKHEASLYTPLLKVGGNLTTVGLPPTPFTIYPGSLLRRITVGGSMVGGIEETQEMLDFCGKNNIVSEIELIKFDYINTAMERMLNADVRFRFVIDVENSL